MNYSKLGRRRKKKLKYRAPKGRHNKIREKMKGHPQKVSIGHKKCIKTRAKELPVIFNVKELLVAKTGGSVILAGVGRKNKLEIAKKAEEKGIKIVNLNIKKFLKKIETEKKKEDTTDAKKGGAEKK